MIFRRAGLTVALGIAAVAGRLEGQGTQFVPAINEGDTLKVWAVAPRLNGTVGILASLRADTLTLGSLRPTVPPQIASVPFGAVRRIDVRRGTHRSTGRIVVGTLLGAAAGGLLGAAIGPAIECANDCTGYNGRAINARDRIGAGPWHNQRGQLIAANVADLHGDIIRDRNQVNKEFALDEKGQQVKGRGDTPNQHDILTGSDSFGRAIAGTADWNCSNWTSNATTGAAMVGHHDRSGGGNSSWNAAHMSRGCSQQNLIATGGAGLFYCFAGN